MITKVQGGKSDAEGARPPARVLIITEMPYQALNLQRLLADMGREATVAVGEDAGLRYLGLGQYQTVILDVDMGYQVIRDFAARLRQDHPGSEVVIMVGWWDERTIDMRSYSDRLIFKPVHPQQLRETLERRVG